MKRGVIGVAIALTLAVGSISAVADTQRQSGKITIAFVPPVLANPAIQAINVGFKNQAKKLGMTAVTIGGQFSPQAQITAVDAAIQRGVKVLAIWPLDPKGILPSLDKARKAGITIFTIWDAGTPAATANFQYDSQAASKQVALLAAAAIKKEGKPCKVGIIEGLPFVTVLKALNDGLEAGAKAGGCTILEKQVNQKDSADGALPIVQAWKTKWGSQMTGVLAYNDPSALGAVAASGGSFDPIITGGNGDPAGVEAIKAGKILASGGAPNVEVGNALAYGAYLVAVKNQTIPKEVQGRISVITMANVGKWVPFPVRNRHALSVRFVKSGRTWEIRTTPDYSLH